MSESENDFNLVSIIKVEPEEWAVNEAEQESQEDDRGSKNNNGNALLECFVLLERCDNDSSEIKADSVEVLTKQDKGDRRCRLTLGFSKPKTPKVPKPQPPVSDMAVKTLKERGESSLQTLDVNRKGISTNKDVGSLLNISLYESITLDDTALDTLNLAPVTIASPAAEKPASPAKKVAKSTAAKPKKPKVPKSQPPVKPKLKRDGSTSSTWHACCKCGHQCSSRSNMMQHFRIVHQKSAI